MALPNTTELRRIALELLRNRLSEKKVWHCLFVAKHLCSFAPALGIPEAQALAAGLLHDIGRALDGEEMLRRAEAYGLPVSEIERKRPNLLHGPIAAEECRRELGIDDPEVYEAIYWHTTGKPGLGLLGRALYVADFSEPTRRYPEAAHTRELLETRGFTEALCYVAGMKAVFLERKKVVAPVSADFFRWLAEASPP
jgi:predicted HD superfamily hydrolase involved in NAD metabolism